jgi:hypothetical protein
MKRTILVRIERDKEMKFPALNIDESGTLYMCGVKIARPEWAELYGINLGNIDGVTVDEEWTNLNSIVFEAYDGNRFAPKTPFFPYVSVRLEYGLEDKELKQALVGAKLELGYMYGDIELTIHQETMWSDGDNYYGLKYYLIDVDKKVAHLYAFENDYLEALKTIGKE